MEQPAGMYQVGTSTGFRALHVMPGVDGPEGVLHSHDYRLEVSIERAELDGRSMVCDLDIVDGAVARVVGTVRDQNLEAIQPADAAAVTVEVFARWAHAALADDVRRAGGEVLTVRMWESPIAYGGYSAPVG